jgi:elongation factor P--beta-lysine ligase
MVYTSPHELTGKRSSPGTSFLRIFAYFLHERGYYEVQTDHLVPAGAFEASIDAIQTRGSFGKGELRASPEIQMKQLSFPKATFRFFRSLGRFR